MSQAGPVHTRAPDIVARTISGETLLVPVRGRQLLDRIFLLNPVAAFIWSQLDGRSSIADLVERVRGRYARVPETEVERDVRFFLSELERRGLARAAEPG